MVALLIITLPVLTAFGTRENWFAPLTGQVYKQAEVDRAVAASHREGRADGHRAGLIEGRVMGHEEGYLDGQIDGHASGRDIGYRDGYEDGSLASYGDGYAAGHRDGCRSLFHALGTTRLMDYWDYHNRLTWVSYFSIDVCG